MKCCGTTAAESEARGQRMPRRETVESRGGGIFRPKDGGRRAAERYPVASRDVVRQDTASNWAECFRWVTDSRLPSVRTRYRQLRKRLDKFEKGLFRCRFRNRLAGAMGFSWCLPAGPGRGAEVLDREPAEFACLRGTGRRRCTGSLPAGKTPSPCITTVSEPHWARHCPWRPVAVQCTWHCFWSAQIPQQSLPQRR